MIVHDRTEKRARENVKRYVDTWNYYYATNRTCSNKHAIAYKMSKDVVNYRFQRILDIAVKYKMNPDIKLQQEEYDELRKDYREFRRWVENQPVDAVPYK